MDYRGRRATIMGLGHFGGGAAAARWLARQGAVVTISDAADEVSLADSLALLADVPIAAVRLGGHREVDFEQADLVVVNPAVRPDSPWLRFARQSGARLCTELELFVENCPARIIGVTGSNGKSTTAAMIASILDAGGRRTFLGGNIGGSLLDDLPRMTPDDWVVLEISSFQLWHFGGIPHAPREDAADRACRLRMAVVTGCSPNHLDWHASFNDYVAAKQRILAGQTPDDFAVLNTFDAEVASWLPLVRGRPILVGGAGIAACTDARADKNVCPTMSMDDLPALSVPGEHSRINAACAAAAAAAAGCTHGDICRGLQRFRGLPQRLERIATIDERQFYNDSTATTPESTIAALRALDAPVWLLAGGKSKGFDFRPLAAEIAGRGRGAVFFGSVRNELLAHVAAVDAQFPCAAVETMQDALDWCWRRSRPGDAVLLSPACASTDQFRNFRERGQRFAALVDGLTHP
jgi:UDP-N-acetylmuramoylalanine--D-glutamate ligase